MAAVVMVRAIPRSLDQRPKSLNGVRVCLAVRISYGMINDGVDIARELCPKVGDGVIRRRFDVA